MTTETKETTIDSPLGKDQLPENTKKEISKDIAETIEDKNIKKLSMDEYTKLMQDAGNYNTIIKEPSLVNAISDHFKGKTGITNKQKDDGKESEQEDKKYSALEARLRATEERLAQTTLNSFVKAHPDIVKYKDTMTQLMQKYSNMGLEDAYDIASRLAKQQDEPQKKVVTQPTSEDGSGNIGDSDRNDAKAKTLEKINDRKTSIDDAVRLAYQLAKAQSQE